MRRRAGAIRRARRARLSAGLGGVVAVLLVTAALARSSDDAPPSQVHVVGPVSTTSTSVIVTTVIEPLPTTTVPAPPTTSRPATTLPPTNRTTVAPRPTTTVAPSTTTTAPAPLRQCDPADVVVTATPGPPAKAEASVSIKVRVAAVNRSSRPCQPQDPSVEFFDTAGKRFAGLSVADVFTFGVGNEVPTWDPGETLAMDMPGSFDCSQFQPCVPGTYTVVAVFGPFRSPPAPFTLT